MDVALDVAILMRDMAQVMIANVQIALDAAELLVRRMMRDGRRRRRRYWVKPWISRRPLQGQYEQLMSELRDEDGPEFRNYTRLDPPMFREMLNRLGPRIEKQATVMRQPLDAGVRLAITLRYLATGDSYKSLEFNFRVSHSAISAIVYEVCEAIFAEYGEEVIQCPTTVAQFRPVAQMFSDRWQFHHAIGALDGKHVAIQCPKNGGSLYFNYKKFHSKILMALVDADYKFLWVDVGANGSASDAQVFNDSQLKEAIEDGTMKFPEDDALPGDDRPMPYFIIGDDAFALRTWMMKPYSTRN